jgi:phage FluMu protein gp41
LNRQDQTELRQAVLLLENPNMGIRIADVIGTPIEKAIALLPDQSLATISDGVRRAIEVALKVAVKTMKSRAQEESSNWWHMGAAVASGAVGGAFGIYSLALELPVSTSIMMRSIADVARSEGADIDDIATQLECVTILALGGPARSDDDAEIGYFLVRAQLAKAVSDAAAHLAAKGLKSLSAPALVRLVMLVSERYSIQVTQKAASQAVPLLGAIGGALINTVFIDHFQKVARGHFICRRLEKKYSTDQVQNAYKSIRDKL